MTAELANYRSDVPIVTAPLYEVGVPICHTRPPDGDSTAFGEANLGNPIPSRNSQRSPGEASTREGR